jgi:hypothetical protein
MKWIKKQPYYVSNAILGAIIAVIILFIFFIITVTSCNPIHQKTKDTASLDSTISKPYNLDSFISVHIIRIQKYFISGPDNSGNMYLHIFWQDKMDATIISIFFCVIFKDDKGKTMMDRFDSTYCTDKKYIIKKNEWNEVNEQILFFKTGIKSVKLKEIFITTEKSIHHFDENEIKYMIY